MDSTSWGWNYPGGPGGPPPPLPPSNSNPPLPPDQPLPPLPTGGDTLGDSKKALSENTANPPPSNFYGTPNDWQQNYGNWNQNTYGNWNNPANNNWSGYGQGPWNAGPPPSGQDATNYNAWNQYWNAGNQQPAQVPPGPALPDQSGKKNDTEFDESKDPELIEFDAQFKTWEQQFEKWREDNKDHPDKSALTKYEETWTKWRDELLTKRKEIKKTKLEQFKSGNENAPKPKPEVAAASGNAPNQAWGSTDPSQQPWTPNPNQTWGQNQSGPNWPPQQNSGQGPVPDNATQGQQGWSSTGSNQGQGWGPNQGQGWGPNQGLGPNPGQGWGPSGPNQGPGWGPNGPSQGQGWGPNGPNQGQGWGPNGPNQGQGNDTSGSNQTQGWGPTGANQGQGWGPPPGFNRPPTVGPGSSGPSQGPGGPPNQGSVGGPPNQGPVGGPPNQGPGGGPNLGPGGLPNQGPPSGPFNQGPGSGPSNLGLGGMPPNQGPGGGPPNQGPGGPPNQGSSWGPNTQNQGSGWGPNGPNQSQWGPSGPNQSQWGPPSGPNQGQGGPPSGPNQGQGGPPSGPNQGQGWGPNQGQNWGSNASGQSQNWGPNGPNGQGWGNHSSNVSESSNTSRGQRNDSPALGPGGKAAGPQDVDEPPSETFGPSRTNWGPPSEKAVNQGPGFPPNIGPPPSSNWGPNLGKDSWGSNKDDLNKGWTGPRNGPPDNDQRSSQWGPPNRGPTPQQRPESFNGPPPGFNENEANNKGNQFNQGPRFNQGNGPNRGQSSNQGPDSEWSTDTFKSMDSGKDAGWTGNRGPNRPPNSGPGWGGPNQGPNSNNQNSARDEAWNSNKLNEKGQSFGAPGDNFNSNSPSDGSRNSGWQGSQRFGGPGMGQNQGPPHEFNRSGPQNFNRSSSQESNQNFGSRLNQRGNQDFDRGLGFDETLPENPQRKRWPSNQDADSMPPGRNVGFGFNKSSPDDRPDPSWNGPNMTGPSHGRGSKAPTNLLRPLLPPPEERNFMQPPPKIMGGRDQKSLIQKPPPLLANFAEPKSLLGTPPPMLAKPEPNDNKYRWNKGSSKGWSQGPPNDNVPKEIKDKGKGIQSNLNNKVKDAPQSNDKDSLTSVDKTENSKVDLKSSEVKKETPKSEDGKETPKSEDKKETPKKDNKEDQQKDQPSKSEDKKEVPATKLSGDKEISNVSEDKKEPVKKAEATPKDKTVTTPVQPKPEITISTQAQTRATGSILALFRQRAQEGGGTVGIPGLDLPKEDKDSKEKQTKDSANPRQGKPPGNQPNNKNLPRGKAGTLDINFAEGRLNIGPIGVKQNASNWKPPGEWYEDEEENDPNNLNESGSAFNDNRRLSMKRGLEDGALGRPGNKMSRFSDAPGLLEGHPGQLPGPHAINFGGPVGQYGSHFGQRQPFGPRGFAPEEFGGPMRGGPGDHFNMGGRGGRGGNRGRGRGGRPESLMNLDVDFASDSSFNRGSFFELGPSRRGIPDPSNDERYPFFELGASDTDQPLHYDHLAGEPPDRRLAMDTPVPKVVDYGHGSLKADFQENTSIVDPLPLFSNNMPKAEEVVPSSHDQTESSVSMIVKSVEEPKIVPIDDLISIPGRFMRPPKLVIVLRGLPGAGKSTLAQMIKNKEIENGGSAPRILCLDDYFMVESEKLVTDSETGRKIKTKIMEYEYEPELEDNYRAALVKSFKKQVDEGFFPFIIIDCVNSHTKHYKEMCDYAKKNEFEVYIGDVEVEVQTCFQRNIHNRSIEDLQKIADLWEKSTIEYFHVNLTDYIQDANIQEVKMEDCAEDDIEDVNMDLEDSPAEEDKEAETFKVIKELMKSKWDTDQTQGDTLDKLDGVRSAKKRMGKAEPQSIEDWLQLSESFKETKAKPGQKTVRWADIEERREQLSARNRGFVVGQTDWQRMTDPTLGSNALVQIKYIEAREK